MTVSVCWKNRWSHISRDRTNICTNLVTSISWVILEMPQQSIPPPVIATKPNTVTITRIKAKLVISVFILETSQFNGQHNTPSCLRTQSVLRWLRLRHRTPGFRHAAPHSRLHSGPGHILVWPLTCQTESRREIPGTNIFVRTEEWKYFPSEWRQKYFSRWR